MCEIGLTHLSGGREEGYRPVGPTGPIGELATHTFYYGHMIPAQGELSTALFKIIVHGGGGDYLQK